MNSARTYDLCDIRANQKAGRTLGSYRVIHLCHMSVSTDNHISYRVAQRRRRPAEYRRLRMKYIYGHDVQTV